MSKPADTSKPPPYPQQPPQVHYDAGPYNAQNDPRANNTYGSPAPGFASPAPFQQPQHTGGYGSPAPGQGYYPPQGAPQGYYGQPQQGGYYGGPPQQQGMYYGPPQQQGMYYGQQPYGARPQGGRGGDAATMGLCAGLCGALCCLDLCLFF